MASEHYTGIIIALCLAVVCLTAVAVVGFWTLWGCVKVLRSALFESGNRQDSVQARWLASEMDHRGSQHTGQALEQATVRAPSSISDVYVGAPHPNSVADPSWDRAETLAGG